jgi:hypothetical protein
MSWSFFLYKLSKISAGCWSTDVFCTVCNEKQEPDWSCVDRTEGKSCVGWDGTPKFFVLRNKSLVKMGFPQKYSFTGCCEYSEYWSHSAARVFTRTSTLKARCWGVFMISRAHQLLILKMSRNCKCCWKATHIGHGLCLLAKIKIADHLTW